MIVGRAAVISAYKRRKKRGQKPVPKDIIDYDELVNVYEGEKIIFKKYPHGVWIFWGFCFIVSFWMLYHFTYGSIVHEFPEVAKFGYRIAKWWEYFCCSVVFFLGILFLSAGKIEYIEFNKALGVLSVRKIALLWKDSRRTYPLSDITDIKVMKRGMKTKHQDTLHYVVIVEIRNRNSCKLLEDYSLKKLKTFALALKDFLGLENANYDDIEVIDNSELF